MKKIKFRFYSRLNLFLDKSSHKKELIHSFFGRQSIKDRIETIGIPHTEVHLILENGTPVDFKHQARGGTLYSVYPFFHNLDLTEDMQLRVPYKGKPKFILDTHLGKLARYLRFYNFDTVYQNKYKDKKIVDIAVEDNRIILTRDHGLLKRKRVVYGFFIHHDDPIYQLASVVDRYNLFSYDLKTNSRCPLCNKSLQKVPKQKIVDRLEPLTKKHYNDFQICVNCDKIYWKGSHYQKNQKLLEKVKCLKIY